MLFQIVPKVTDVVSTILATSDNKPKIGKLASDFIRVALRFKPTLLTSKKYGKGMKQFHSDVYVEELHELDG
jgi:hypothetical protein